MRTAAKIDSNQRAVIDALESAGMCVQSLAAVGQGVPDLLVGWRGINVLLEVKDGSARYPSQRKMNATQQEWHSTWGGQVCVVESGEAAVLAVLRQAVKLKVISAVTAAGTLVQAFPETSFAPQPVSLPDPAA